MQRFTASYYNCSRRQKQKLVIQKTLDIKEKRILTNVHENNTSQKWALRITTANLQNRINLSYLFETISETYPQLQTSMAGPYLSSPSSSSGGRYHNVITLLVYGRSLSSDWYNRARPRSASFSSPLHTAIDKQPRSWHACHIIRRFCLTRWADIKQLELMPISSTFM